jgi:hypothetical protein
VWPVLSRLVDDPDALEICGVIYLDLEHFPNCGSEPKIIAAILEAPVIEKIFSHLGLQTRVPPRSPARGRAFQAA